nr:zinc ribbon domain-containing protein [Rhodococcus marinonascens]
MIGEQGRDLWGFEAVCGHTRSRCSRGESEGRSLRASGHRADESTTRPTTVRRLSGFAESRAPRNRPAQTGRCRSVPWASATTPGGCAASRSVGVPSTCSSRFARAKQRLDLAERTFRCETCGFTTGRDWNAAGVVLAVAERGPTCVDDVRHVQPSFGSAVCAV